MKAFSSLLLKPFAFPSFPVSTGLISASSFSLDSQHTCCCLAKLTVFWLVLITVSDHKPFF